MATDTSSFVATHLIEGLSHVMPEDQQAKLAPYAERAARAGSNKTAEWHRAYKCAKWAEQIVSLPAHNHLVAESKKALEAIKEIEETVGSEIGDLLELPLGISVSPEFEAEITWVYEAVHVAEKVANKVGWDAVPWEQLVEDVLSVTDPTG
jgi:hypothetical protein